MTNLVARILDEGSPAEPSGAPRDLHPLFAAYPVASLLYGCDGSIVAANAAALELFRCGTAQLIGASLASFMLSLIHI